MNAETKVEMKPAELLAQTIKNLQAVTPEMLNNNSKRKTVKDMLATCVRCVSLLIIENPENQKMPAHYKNILCNKLGRVQALKSKQVILEPILTEVLNELVKEPIDENTPVSLLEAARFITKDLDYEVVDKGVTQVQPPVVAPSQPVANPEPISKVGVEITKQDDTIQATVEVSSTADKAKSVDDLFDDAPENEHHMNLTDDTSISVDEVTGEVYFYDSDGKIVATTKLKRMFIRWKETAIFFLSDIFDSFKKLFLATVSAAGIVLCQVGLSGWQIIKSPYTAYKEAKRLKSQEWYDNGNPLKFA
jgi:hypothetical protein